MYIPIRRSSSGLNFCFLRKAYLPGYFEQSYSLAGDYEGLRTGVIDGYFGCDTIASLIVLSMSGLGILLLVSITFYVFAHIIHNTGAEMRNSRWYASLRSAEVTHTHTHAWCHKATKHSDIGFARLPSLCCRNVMEFWRSNTSTNTLLETAHLLV